MQILLTKPEFDALSMCPTVEDHAKVCDERQALCIKLALATQDYCLAVPYTCKDKGEVYCDSCPAADFCHEPRQDWSK